MGDLELPDVNVLVALLHSGHVHHAEAHRWFAATARFATTPITQIGLLRLTLNPTVVGRAVTRKEALAALTALTGHQRAVFLADDSSVTRPAVDLVGLVGFKQVTDFHLVNLAATHGARLVTFDRKLAPTLTVEDQRWVKTLG